ncbi:hypothetical protein TWF481_002989 [Arthrobotrys musiformis]|uniref:Uncharacterized protein n=1 Tax=Arthrobotrys musiformis TaxID=47236 RepID=A0AAV9VU11_9PEZI
MDLIVVLFLPLLCAADTFVRQIRYSGPEWRNANESESPGPDMCFGDRGTVGTQLGLVPCSEIDSTTWTLDTDLAWIPDIHRFRFNGTLQNTRSKNCAIFRSTLDHGRLPSPLGPLGRVDSTVCSDSSSWLELIIQGSIEAPGTVAIFNHQFDPYNQYCSNAQRGSVANTYPIGKGSGLFVMGCSSKDNWVIDPPLAQIFNNLSSVALFSNKGG